MHLLRFQYCGPAHGVCSNHGVKSVTMVTVRRATVPVSQWECGMAASDLDGAFLIFVLVVGLTAVASRVRGCFPYRHL